jgi:hypothetical protein
MVDQKEVYETYQDGRGWIEKHPTLTVLFAIVAIAGAFLLGKIIG